MSATGINEVRIYNAVLSDEQAQQRADVAVSLLAAALVRSLRKKPRPAAVDTRTARPRERFTDLAANGGGL